MNKNPFAIVAFAGPAGSGKDTAGKYLIDRCGFKRLPFAGPLKAMLAAMGYPEPKTAEDKEKLIPELGVSWRHMAQTLGTEWGRKLINEDLWVILAERLIRTEGGQFVITDLRFDNEAVLVRRLGGVVGQLIGRAYPMPAETAGHASEAGVAFGPEDRVFSIDNGPDDLDALYNQLDGLARMVGWSPDVQDVIVVETPAAEVAPAAVEPPAEEGAAA